MKRSYYLWRRHKRLLTGLRIIASYAGETLHAMKSATFARSNSKSINVWRNRAVDAELALQAMSIDSARENRPRLLRHGISAALLFINGEGNINRRASHRKLKKRAQSARATVGLWPKLVVKAREAPQRSDEAGISGRRHRMLVHQNRCRWHQRSVNNRMAMHHSFLVMTSMMAERIFTSISAPHFCGIVIIIVENIA